MTYCNAQPDWIIVKRGISNFLIETLERKIPIISQSIMELFESRMNESDAYKSIALMRHGFGEHPFGKNEGIIKESKTSRIQKV
jgi:6-phosphogluconate dehydrogenase